MGHRQRTAATSAQPARDFVPSRRKPAARPSSQTCVTHPPLPLEGRGLDDVLELWQEVRVLLREVPDDLAVVEELLEVAAG
jgi:hypothetical protein